MHYIIEVVSLAHFCDT